MRKDVIREESVIHRILDAADLLHLAICDAEGPFCVPVNFARSEGTLYVHSAMRGRKAAALENGTVGFSAVTSTEIKQAEQACKWGYHFESVRGTAHSHLVTDEQERNDAVDAIVRHYAGESLPLDAAVMRKTAVFALVMGEVTARIKR